MNIHYGLILLLFYALLGSQLSCEKEVAVSDPKPLDTFAIDVETPIPADHKIDATFEYIASGKATGYPGSIERRGGFSSSYAKHSYEIDLKEDVPLGGLPADDDWILNANYIDKTFLRHVIAYELFREMDSDNEAPKTAYLELALNGSYSGLYVLMEKLDRSSLQVDKSASAAVIFKEPQLFRESYDGVVAQDSLNFHQQTYPKLAEADKTDFIEGIRDFILTSTDTDFKAGMQTTFDLPNLVDWHLLLLVTNNSDGILKNFYLYKADAATPLRIAPWDYDHSFGRDGDNELNLDERPLRIKRSILFARLLKHAWYRAMLKERWTALNEKNLLSVAGLKQRITTKAAEVRPAAIRNFEVWPVDGPGYYDGNGFDEEIDIMLQFVDLRHDRLKSYFSGL